MPDQLLIVRGYDVEDRHPPGFVHLGIAHCLFSRLIKRKEAAFKIGGKDDVARILNKVPAQPFIRLLPAARLNLLFERLGSFECLVDRVAIGCVTAQT